VPTWAWVLLGFAVVVGFVVFANWFDLRDSDRL
jgi:hypothetical protein